MSNTFHESAHDLPIVSDVDICVVGGSATGVFAAVRAARLGARVCIVEKQNRFGGVATCALVNVWHSLYDEVFETQIISGLTEETAQRLRRRNAVTFIDDNDSRAFVFNSAELAIELDNLIVEHNIEPRLNTILSAPIMEGDKLLGIAIEDASGRRAIRAKYFVDATGDGHLCHRMGLPMYTPDHLQPPTACAHIGGWSVLGDEGPQPTIHAHRDEFDLPEGFVWGAEIPNSDVHMIAGTRVHGVNTAIAEDLTKAEIEGRRQIRGTLDLLNKYAADGTMTLQAIGSQIGVRETRHIESRYRMTDNDALYGVRFDDAIANGSYRIDVHHQDKPGITLRYLNGTEVWGRTGEDNVFSRWRPETAKNPTFYQIPLRSLIPRESVNIIVAGRMMDAEEQAFGAARVMVNMNQTGEAAGTTAYLALDADSRIPAVDPGRVRESLAAGGSIIF
jgi:hypothetical protein